MTAASRPHRVALSGGPLAALIAVVIGISAACGSDAIVTNAPSPTSTPNVTAGASRLSPPPSAAPDPGQTAMRAFVAFATSKGAAYQATFTGEDRHSTDILPISKGLLQVSGRDVLVRATFTFPTGNHHVVEHRYIGGRAWIRKSPGPWQGLTFVAAQSMGAFAAIHGPADVTYVGPKTSGGKTLYQLRFRSVIVNPVMIPATNLTEVVVTTSTLTLLVDAKGRPVRAAAEIDGRGRVSGQLQEIIIDLDLTFTKVGQPVRITAP